MKLNSAKNYAPNVKKSLHFLIIMVAKQRLMITHLGGRQEVLALRGFEFKRDPDIPARNFLPEGEASIPSLDQNQDNKLNLYENHKPVACVDN